MRALTDRPFVVNHVVSTLDEDAFQATLDARPAAVSFALGDPGALVERAHSAGAKVIHQVHTVAQAREAAALGVDVVIAQGSEAGGQGMAAGVGTMALVPQVVDAVLRSRCSRLAGSRTAAGWPPRSCSAPPARTWARASSHRRRPPRTRAGSSDIIDAESEDTVRFETWGAIMPPPAPGAYDVVPRVIRTEFVSRWESRPDEAAAESERLLAEIMAAVRRGPDARDSCRSRARPRG